MKRKEGRELNKNQDGNTMTIHLCLHISMPRIKSLPFSAAQQLSDIESGGVALPGVLQGESSRDCTYQGAPTPTIAGKAELRRVPLANLESTQTLKNRRPRTHRLPPPHTTSYLECSSTVPSTPSPRRQYLICLHLANSNNCGGTLPEVNLVLPIIDVEGPF